MENDQKLRYTFRYAEKLHLQKDFDQAFKLGRKMVNPAILIFVYLPQEASGNRRLGLVTSRKLGNAVKRNKLKRLQREVFRLNKHRIKPGTDLIFIPRPKAASLQFKELESIIISLLERGKALI